MNTVTGTIVPIDPQCLPLGTKRYLRHIELDWDSGGISPSRVDYSGPVCFELHSFNDILYTPSFTLTEKIPSGSAIDLLKDAISTVTGFSVTGEAKSSSPGLETVTPCQQLSQHVANAQAQAALFESALSQLDPGKAVVPAQLLDLLRRRHHRERRGNLGIANPEQRAGTRRFQHHFVAAPAQSAEEEVLPGGEA